MGHLSYALKFRFRFERGRKSKSMFCNFTSNVKSKLCKMKLFWPWRHIPWCNSVTLNTALLICVYERQVPSHYPGKQCEYRNHISKLHIRILIYLSYTYEYLRNITFRRVICQHIATLKIIREFSSRQTVGSVDDDIMFTFYFTCVLMNYLTRKYW